MDATRSIWARARDVANVVATPLVPSHFFELIDPLTTTHVRHARVVSIEDETARARTLTLRPGRGFRAHRPGQFVAIGVEVDGRIVTRTYSITSSPDRRDGAFTITVERVPGGRVSTVLTERIARGDYVRIGLPQGEFTMRDAPPERVLFVTGGSGITPVMSMLRTFEARASMPDLVHVHFARTREDVIFARELERLARETRDYRPTILTTREGARTHFDRALLDTVAPDWVSRETWACGPESLLESVEHHVPSRLHVERFRPKRVVACVNEHGGRVRFGRSKKELDGASNVPLLQVAEHAGIDAPHGCRMGICHSCDATMVSGAVRDLRTGKRIDEPGARIQPCVCAAAGDVEIDL